MGKDRGRWKYSAVFQHGGSDGRGAKIRSSPSVHDLIYEWARSGTRTKKGHEQEIEGQTDGRMDGWTDGRRDG